ncbi:MAG: RNA polymerase subunit sigma-70 [Chloroflexota bacterium]
MAEAGQAAFMAEGNEVRLLAAARAGDADAFQALTDPFRYELRVHCYRMVGSLQDAEDMVQETLLRAWRRLESFEQRASIRAWLYKIATNACLDTLDKQRRILPHIGQVPMLGAVEPEWLEPCPDDWFNDVEVSPEARYSARESMALAFLVALQLLPARQRAILILCDVLDWQAREVAELLETTNSAVNNALQRARKTLQERAAERPANSFSDLLPASDALRAALDRYVRAWETADISALTAMLKEDAVMAMPPSGAWFEGRDAIRRFTVEQIFPFMGAEKWRFKAIEANGQPAFAVYEPDKTGTHYQAHSIHTLRFDGLAVAEIIVFYSPELFRFFGLPDQVEAV